MTSLTLDDFEQRALAALCDYAAIPCLSPLYDANWRENGYIDEAAELLARWARRRTIANFDVTVHQLEDRTPMLVVTVEATAPGLGTTLLYGHLDKQPPLGDWSEGLDPFEPVRRGDRLYARGVADDGYAAFSALLAIEAMEAAHVPHSRCVILIEASEESSSLDLDAYLDVLHEHLGNVELMICLDSGALTYDRLWVTTSLRGLVNVELKVRVLDQGRHSGSASGVVPSSFRILRQLLDRVEDAVTGDILLEELRSEIPEHHVRAAESVADELGDIVAKEIPPYGDLALMGSSAKERLLRRSWFPALSVVGMGGVPEPEHAGNVLRPYTTALLSFRLPPNVDSTIASDAIINALTTNVPSSATVTATLHAADGWVIPPIAPWLAQALERASHQAFGNAPGFTGEGGSIPFLASLGRRFPDVQFVATGVLGPDSNAHAIDEMLDLAMAVGVTNAVATILAEYAAQQKEQQ